MTATTIRRPADAFETSLYRQLIVACVERWSKQQYTATVSRAANEDGTWTLTVAERIAHTVGDRVPGTVGALDMRGWPRVETGTIWVGERDGRAEVQWSIMGRTGTGEFGPAVTWGVV